MRDYSLKLRAIVGLCLLAQSAIAGNLDINEGNWQISYDANTNTVDYRYGGTPILKGVTVRATDADGQMLTASQYAEPVLSSENISNAFGEGIRYTYTFASAGNPTLEQSFQFFPERDYFFTEAAIIDLSGNTASNHVAAIYTQSDSQFLPAEGDNRVYTMPFDNDAWRTYESYHWSNPDANTSYEVGAFYDVISRKGLIVGSVEHFLWKTGVVSTVIGTNTLSQLEVYGGIADEGTNDTIEPALPVHGMVKGERVESPLIMVGYFDDWRIGLEAIGEATAEISPKLSLPEDMPESVWGWQSWGEQAQYVNYSSIKEVAKFYADELVPANFCSEDGVCYMCLDSFWSDNMTDSQVKSFASYCDALGLVPGLYAGFFSLWWDAHDWDMTDTDGKYKWGEAMLTANGEYRKCGGGSYCIDPTHPGTEMLIRKCFDRWRTWGYRFVKIDFMSNGAVEADKWYCDTITTGIAAFNYGMDIIIDAAGDDFVLDFSIAPVFPNKTHARRSGCDTWKSESDTQYVLTNQSLGWWLDRVYNFNDPDALCMRGERYGVNRMRYMTGIMNSFTLFGDDFSYYGDWEEKTTEAGVDDRRARAIAVGTNEEINKIGRLGRSFRPLEGSLDNKYNKYADHYCDADFILETNDCIYLVHYNFDDNNAVSRTIDYNRIGIDAPNISSIRELWNDIEIEPGDDSYTVPISANDVAVIKIDKNQAGIHSANLDGESSLKTTWNHGILYVTASSAILRLTLYGANGQQMANSVYSGFSSSESLASNLTPGVYMLTAITSKGLESKKIVVR